MSARSGYPYGAHCRIKRLLSTADRSAESTNAARTMSEPAQLVIGSIKRAETAVEAGPGAGG